MGDLTRDHVVWAFRLLLDREPENEHVIDAKLAPVEHASAARRVRHVRRVSGEEQGFRARERAEPRDQAARERRAAGGRSRRPRDRLEHPARPVRARRACLRALCGGPRRPRARLRGTHRPVRNPPGVVGRSVRIGARIRALRGQRRVPCPVDRGERLQGSRGARTDCRWRQSRYSSVDVRAATRSIRAARSFKRLGQRLHLDTRAARSRCTRWITTRCPGRSGS